MQLEGEAAKMALMTMAKGMSGATNQPRKTKLDCPECKGALNYTELGVIHQDPPRRRVKCSWCDFKGFHFLDGDHVSKN